jgi:hypothetical protein
MIYTQTLYITRGFVVAQHDRQYWSLNRVLVSNCRIKRGKRGTRWAEFRRCVVIKVKHQPSLWWPSLIGNMDLSIGCCFRIVEQREEKREDSSWSRISMLCRHQGKTPASSVRKKKMLELLVGCESSPFDKNEWVNHSWDPNAISCNERIKQATSPVQYCPI